MEYRWQHQGEADSRVSPRTYTVFDDSVEKLFQEVIPLLNPESRILEIGCNAGRNLNYLYQKGFRHLTGIEIGRKAIGLFSQTFPEALRSTHTIVGNAVEVIRRMETGAYDLVFTHSVLVNIGADHNDFFGQMTRICRGYILTLESEGSWNVFPRNFQRMFERNGYAMVSYRFLVLSEEESTPSRLTFPHPLKPQHRLQNNTIRLFVPIDRKRI